MEEVEVEQPHLPVLQQPPSSRLPPPPPPPPPAAAAEAGEQDEQEQPAPQGRHTRISYSVSIFTGNSTTSAAASARMSNDTCSCFLVTATFCFFASMTLILGFCGSENLVLGPNTSWLLQANSFFAQDIQVQDQDSSADPAGAVVYGFSRPPPLDVEVTWTETHHLSILPNMHQEWAYYLSGEAQVNVSYLVLEDQGSSSSLSLAIVKGKQSLLEWIDDPLFPDTTLSWNLIHGNGFINQKISKPSDYYVSVANVNQLPVKVYLNFSIQAWLYNTTAAYYKCSLNQSSCVTNLFVFAPNVVVITTSNLTTDGENKVWNISVSFSPRWITYFVGSVIVTLMMILALKFIAQLFTIAGGSNNEGATEVANERTPLLSNKDDDDDASMGSSYESVSHDENEEYHRKEEEAHFDPNVMSTEAGKDGLSEHICVICFGAPKDSFFLPCGHCATCFSCGTKITEEAGNCPFCRRRTKKVRRIYNI